MLLVEEENEGSYSLCQVELGSSGSSLCCCGWLCGCCYDRVSETAPKLIDKASMTAGAYSGLQGPQLRVLGKFGGDA